MVSAVNSNIVPFPKLCSAPTPILVMMDLHHAELEDPNSLQVLDCCKNLLAYARELGIRVAHSDRILADPIPVLKMAKKAISEILRPHVDEMVFERFGASCYSNSTFASLLSVMPRPHLILVGWNLNRTGLATCLDAHQMGHDVTVLSDACLCRNLSAPMDHACIIEMVSHVASVATCEEARNSILSYPETDFEDVYWWN